jgi:hypothetical protein
MSSAGFSFATSLARDDRCSAQSGLALYLSSAAAVLGPCPSRRPCMTAALEAAGVIRVHTGSYLLLASRLRHRGARCVRAEPTDEAVTAALEAAFH